MKGSNRFWFLILFGQVKKNVPTNYCWCDEWVGDEERESFLPFAGGGILGILLER